jgi:hypothetical protein
MNTQDEQVISQENIQQINITIEELETSINKAETLRQLQENPLFKEIILEGYMEDNAIRLVHLKGASQMQDKVQQKGLDNQIMGIACLGEHFRAIYAMASLAEKRLEEYTRELEEVQGVETDE